MKFFSTVDLLRHAYQNGYAIAAINVFNMESVQAAVQAAQEEQAPLIVMCEQRDIGYAGMRSLYCLAAAAVEEATVPIALHLDHGNDFNIVRDGIEFGFSSVMIDGSQLPFEDNIALTTRVVQIAHPVGVAVEAELGHVGGGEAEGAQDVGILTDPDLAAEFARQTKVDALAVAIGTAHGVYVTEPKLDFDRLAEIRRKADIPLVLHGGSGTPDDSLKQAVAMGIAKINVGTDVRRRFVQTVLENGKEDREVRDVLKLARDVMKEIVRDRIRVFGSAGKSRML